MVPIQFEYEDEVFCLGSWHPVKKFVTVLNMFKHHYSGEFMYRIREDHISPLGAAVSDERTISESEIAYLLETRVTE